jgi:hypothetical protein
LFKFRWFNLIVPTVIKAHEQQRAAAEAEAGTSSGRGKRDRVDEEKHASVVDTVLKRAIQVVRLGAYGANLGYYLYKIVNDA